jgi:hypothetical protein
VKGIEGSDCAEVSLGMKNPGAAAVRVEVAVDEVYLNTLNWASRLYGLKWSRS